MNIETLIQFVSGRQYVAVFFLSNEEKGKGTLTSAVSTGGARPFRHNFFLICRASAIQSDEAISFGGVFIAPI
jgi:hypothetical protein